MYSPGCFLSMMPCWFSTAGFESWCLGRGFSWWFDCVCECWLWGFTIVDVAYGWGISRRSLAHCYSLFVSTYYSTLSYSLTPLSTEFILPQLEEVISAWIRKLSLASGNRKLKGECFLGVRERGSLLVLLDCLRNSFLKAHISFRHSFHTSSMTKIVDNYPILLSPQVWSSTRYFSPLLFNYSKACQYSICARHSSLGKAIDDFILVCHYFHDSLLCLIFTYWVNFILGLFCYCHFINKAKRDLSYQLICALCMSPFVMMIALNVFIP